MAHFPRKVLCTLMCWCPALIAAGHNVLLPQPQAVRYGEGRLALKGLSVVLASASAPEDQFTVRRLSDGLARRRAHVPDLRKARLQAETAQERLYEAASKYPESLSSFVFGARLLDYAGMKFLHAVEMADIYAKLGPASTRADVSFWLGRQASARNHGRIGDLMDLITELRDEYRKQWQQEYTAYRLGTALGRFDAEFEYWRRFQARLWEVRSTFQEGKPLPPLDSLRR